MVSALKPFSTKMEYSFLIIYPIVKKNGSWYSIYSVINYQMLRYYLLIVLTSITPDFIS